MSNKSQKTRVIAYVDGFNVYHGLKYVSPNPEDRSLYWLDIYSAVRRLLRGGEELVSLRYYTAKRLIPELVEWTADQKQQQIDSNARQDTYLAALRTNPRVKVQVQRFSERSPHLCRECGYTWPRFEEKQTDVRMAVDLVRDAFEDRFDAAAIITADTDIVPAIDTVIDLNKSLNRRMSVIPLKPLGRPASRAIMDASGRQWRRMTKRLIRETRLPPELTSDTGRIIRCPTEWGPEIA